MSANIFGPDGPLSELGKLFGADKAESKPPKSKPTEKPLPQIRGKKFGDAWYVSAEDVADALESQSANINARLIQKLRDLRKR